MKTTFLKCGLVIAGALLISVSSMNAQKKKAKIPFDWAAEVELLGRPDVLPSYRTNQIVEQESSWDRTNGNDDGFSGTHSFIGKEGGRLILADFKGPGVLNRIWTPTPTNDTLRFYFDGEKEPRITVAFNDLFSGKVYPFVKPICSNEVGGFYCYMPIPFAKSLKITYAGPRIQFHQIQYRALPGYEVKSYIPALTPEVKNAIESAGKQWNNIFQSIADFAKGPSADYEVKTETFTLQPGQSVPFFQMNKGGRIVGFEIDGGDSFEGLTKDIILSAKWDNDATPAIQAPLVDFFGYGYGEPAMRSMIIGTRGTMSYCYMPAPFDQNAEMKLTYATRNTGKQSPVTITTKVYYNKNARIAAQEGKFYTVWSRFLDAEKGKYHTFANLKGKGHYVGTIHWAQALIPGMTQFFEGDDSIYVDGKMRMHGTGSEDYYNGGWYALLDRWDRGVSLPIHGSLDYSLQMGRTGGYRFYTTDKMPFEKEIFVGIEHGPTGNEWPVDYASIAFYYGDTPPASAMEVKEELRNVPQPTSHVFYPQLMLFTVAGSARVNSGATITVDNSGYVRVMFDEIPEGRYNLYIDYNEEPDGAEFSVWQRQKQLTEWKSSYKAERKENPKVFMGEIELTKQTNSISVHVRKDGDKKAFHMGCIHLERIK